MGYKPAGRSSVNSRKAAARIKSRGDAQQRLQEMVMAKRETVASRRFTVAKLRELTEETRKRNLEIYVAEQKEHARQRYDQALEAFRTYHPATTTLLGPQSMPPALSEAQATPLQVTSEYQMFSTESRTAAIWDDPTKVGKCSECLGADTPLVTFTKESGVRPQCKWCIELNALNFHLERHGSRGKVVDTVVHKTTPVPSFIWSIYMSVCLAVLIQLIYILWK